MSRLVKEFAFGLSPVLICWGAIQTSHGERVPLIASACPTETMRLRRMVVNAPARGTFYISRFRIANVDLLTGVSEPGRVHDEKNPFPLEDAFNYSDPANTLIDFPVVTPGHRITVEYEYTGYNPPGFCCGQLYILTTTFYGSSDS